MATVSSKKIEEFIDQQRKKGKRDATIRVFLRSKGIDLEETSLSRQPISGFENDEKAVVPTSENVKKESPFQNPILRGLDKFGQTASDVAIGAAKGFASSVKGALGLVGKGLETFAPKPKPGVETVGESVEAIIPESITTPEGRAEKIGKGVEQVAEFFVPGGAATKTGKAIDVATKGLPKIVRIISRLAGKGATEAMTIGGTTAVQTGEVGEESKDAALFGAFLPVVNKALGSVAAQFTKRLPARLIQSAVGQSKKELLAGKDVSNFIINEKRIGTADSLIQKSQNEIESIGEKISQKLKSMPGTVVVGRNKILDDIAKSINESGGAITRDEVFQIVNRLAPQSAGLLKKSKLTLVEANKLRQSLDKTIGDKGFLMSQLPFNKEVLKDFTNVLREEVKQKAPEGTRALFSTIASEITLRNALLNKYAAKGGNQILTFGDIIGAGIGTFGGLPGAALGLAGRRILQSPAFLTLSGVSLGQLQKLQPIWQKLTDVERGVLSQIIQGLSDENAETSTLDISQ